MNFEQLVDGGLLGSLVAAEDVAKFNNVRRIASNPKYSAGEAAVRLIAEYPKEFQKLTKGVLSSAEHLAGRIYDKFRGNPRNGLQRLSDKNIGKVIVEKSIGKGLDLSHKEKNKLKKIVTGNPKSKGRQAKLGLSKSIAPAAAGFTWRHQEPKISNRSSDGCRVTHCEPLPVLDSTGLAFNRSHLSINPGISSFSRWLPGIASRYEFYQFVKLEFIYTTAVGSNMAGNGCMCFDPDLLDINPQDLNDMLYMKNSLVFAAWDPEVKVLEVDNFSLHSRQTYRVRTTDVPIDGSPEIYDVGLLHLATEGVTYTPVVGRVFVRYIIDFRVEAAKFLAINNVVSGYFESSTPVASSKWMTGSIANTNVTAAQHCEMVTSGSTTELIIRTAGFFFVTVKVIGTGVTSTPDIISPTGYFAGLNYPTAMQRVELFTSLGGSVNCNTCFLVYTGPQTMHGYRMTYSNSATTASSFEMAIATVSPPTALMLLKHHKSLNDIEAFDAVPALRLVNLPQPIRPFQYTKVACKSFSSSSSSPFSPPNSPTRKRPACSLSSDYHVVSPFE
jgi:hypothetical protein